MLQRKLNTQDGFAHLIAIITIVSTLIIGFSGYQVYETSSKNKAQAGNQAIRPTPKKIPNHNVSKGTHIVSRGNSTPTTPVTTPAPPKAQAPSAQTTPVANFTTSIQIKGDAGCQSATFAALKLLNNNAPSHYANIVNYVGIIECVSQGSGMLAYESPPRYLVGDATRNAGTVWYAGTIAHDAGHSRLYHEYLASHPNQAVPDSAWTGEAAERTCLDAQYDALTKIGGTQGQLDYVKNIINSQYYNVPYDQRWW